MATAAFFLEKDVPMLFVCGKISPHLFPDVPVIFCIRRYDHHRKLCQRSKHVFCFDAVTAKGLFKKCREYGVIFQHFYNAVRLIVHLAGTGKRICGYVKDIFDPSVQHKLLLPGKVKQRRCIAVAKAIPYAFADRGIQISEGCRSLMAAAAGY